MRIDARRHLMSNLYDVPVTYGNKVLREIITDNNKLAGNNYTFGSINYKDKIYTVERPEYFTYVFVKTYPPLHIDIEKRMEAYVNLLSGVHPELEKANRFLIILFNFVGHSSEIEDILGTTLANQVKPYWFFFNLEPKPSHEITAFKTKFSEYIDMLNQRYMDNVLMTGEYSES